MSGNRFADIVMDWGAFRQSHNDMHVSRYWQRVCDPTRAVEVLKVDLHHTRKSMRKLVIGAAAGISLAFAAACSDATSEPVPQVEQAELKVLHATAGVGALDVDVGDTRVISGLSSAKSAKTLVPAGMQRVRIRQGATLLADLQTLLTTEHVNVVTLANGAAQVSRQIPPRSSASTRRLPVTAR